MEKEEGSANLWNLRRWPGLFLASAGGAVSFFSSYSQLNLQQLAAPLPPCRRAGAFPVPWTSSGCPQDCPVVAPPGCPYHSGREGLSEGGSLE